MSRRRSYGASGTGSLMLYLLASIAGPSPSGSPELSRRYRGCLPPSPTFPRSGCPPLQSDRCDGLTAQVSHLRSVTQRLVAQHRVPVEPGDRAQPAGDGGAGPAAGFHVTGEALDVGAAGPEQAQVPLLAPARILAQVQRVGLAGQAGITGQEPGQRQPLVAGKYRLGDGSRGGCGRCG